ncbi:DUF2147 domain-containing protein [Rhizobium sp. 2YAF20]|uniref:DUF2147 domain-containing protein n=1 Tax=Rhizobium sp. 2YAF20 TaxID=3233027 RepID=UPI003F9B3FC6
MIRIFALAAALALTARVAYAADAIVGDWKTEDGSTAAISQCGGEYCITLKTGEYAGRKIGSFSDKDGSYAGRLTDPDSDKTYDGVLSVSGNNMNMKGCVMKVFCETQTWTRL